MNEVASRFDGIESRKWTCYVGSLLWENDYVLIVGRTFGRSIRRADALSRGASRGLQIAPQIGLKRCRTRTGDPLCPTLRSSTPTAPVGAFGQSPSATRRSTYSLPQRLLNWGS